jgi:tetratricopeptide (TPR) repeat protein
MGGRLGISPPRPTKAEREALALRADVDARLEAARTRLEGAELLLAGAPRDAILLCRELLRDLGSVLRALDTAEEGHPLEELSRRRDELAGHVSQLAGGDVDRAAASRVVDDLRVLLRDVVLRYRLLARTSLATKLDAWRGRARLAAAVGVAGILALAVAVRSQRSPGPEARAAAFDRDFTAGMAALNEGDAARAAQLFGHAVEVHPDAPRVADAYNDLGWSLAKLGRYDEAIAAYEAALRKAPGADVYRNNLALAKRERDAKRR